MLKFEKNKNSTNLITRVQANKEITINNGESQNIYQLYYTI